MYNVLHIKIVMKILFRNKIVDTKLKCKVKKKTRALLGQRHCLTSSILTFVHSERWESVYFCADINLLIRHIMMGHPSCDVVYEGAVL